MSRSYKKVICWGSRSSAKDFKRLDYKRMRCHVRSIMRDAIDCDDYVFPEKRREVGDIWSTSKEYSIVMWESKMTRNKVVMTYTPSNDPRWEKDTDREEFFADMYKYICK